MKHDTKFIDCVFESGQHTSESTLVKSVNDMIAAAIIPATNRKDLRAVFIFDDVLRKIRLIIRCDEDEAFFTADELKQLLVLQLMVHIALGNSLRKRRLMSTTVQISYMCIVTLRHLHR